MANIPVEPKANQPWWLWLLLALGVLLVLALLARGCDDEDDRDATDTRSEAGPVMDPSTAEPDTAGPVDLGAADPGGAITTFDDLFTADDPSTLTGRRVTLTRARVAAVPGDSTFIISPEGDDSRQFVVVLEGEGEEESGAGGSDGRYDIDEGDVIDFSGSVQTYNEGMAGVSSLDAGQRQELTDRRVFLRVGRLDIRESAAAPAN